MKELTKKTKIIIGIISGAILISCVGTLATLHQIAKKQSAQAVSEIKALQSQMVINIVDKAECQVDKEKDRIYGKYGHISISGVLDINSVRYQTKSAKETGCQITYNFNQAGVSGRLAGRKLVVDLYNSGFIKIHKSTNIDKAYQDLKPLD